MRLRREFYIRSTLRVAHDLLGKFIVRKVGSKRLSGKIVEVESYIGPADRASHAFGGKVTKRNRAEYLVGGHIYIYLVYGMYWQLNISTSCEGRPECVLIRALEVEGENGRIASGPGKLCHFLKLDKSFYGEDLTRSLRIWIEDRGLKILNSDICRSERIGIDYAGPVWSKKPWRFFIKGNLAVSQR